MQPTVKTDKPFGVLYLCPKPNELHIRESMAALKRDIKASFQITSWNEDTVGEEMGVSKLTRAVVTQSYTGGLEGIGSVSYAMHYRDEKTATFVGYERFEGVVSGKAGSFVMKHDGVFKDGKASSDWAVVIESGTDELADVSGEGTFKAGHAGTARVVGRLLL